MSQHSDFKLVSSDPKSISKYESAEQIFSRIAPEFLGTMSRIDAGYGGDRQSRLDFERDGLEVHNSKTREEMK